MSGRIEITDADGHKRFVGMPGARLLVGSAAGADVQVRGPGIEAQHLRFVRSGAGVRVEPVQPGGSVTVNGERLFCKDLGPDDVVELGRAQLRWIAAGPPAEAQAAAGRGKVSSRRHKEPARRAATRRRSAVPAWLPVTGVIAAVLVAAVLVLRALSESKWPSTPAQYVELARQQAANDKPQLALETLAFVLEDATGAVREEALGLEATLRQLVAEGADSAKVQAARAEHDRLRSFQERYLRDAAGRPAAREFVRLCDQWLSRHGAVCRANTEGQPLLRFVEEQRARHVALAGLGEPDTAADVTFAAQSRLRFTWRDYRGAVDVLDRFLKSNDDAAVRAERERLVTEGLEWLSGKLRNVDLLLERGDRDNAEKDLQQIERWAMLPEWEGLVKERRARLEGAR
jgi:hypothetical protein